MPLDLAKAGLEAWVGAIAIDTLEHDEGTPLTRASAGCADGHMPGAPLPGHPLQGRLLILDEATASIDAETERLVQTDLATLLRGRTAFIIAHRLSTVKHADRIIVLDQGRLVESGTHAELLTQRGIYYTSLFDDVCQPGGGAQKGYEVTARL